MRAVRNKDQVLLFFLLWNPPHIGSHTVASLRSEGMVRGTRTLKTTSSRFLEEGQPLWGQGLGGSWHSEMLPSQPRCLWAMGLRVLCFEDGKECTLGVCRDSSTVLSCTVLID